MVKMSDEQYRDLASFRRSLRSYSRTADQVARKVGITPAQHQLLVAIRGASGRVAPSISWLADELQVEAHSATGLVQRAEQAGLVVIQQPGDDGRVRSVELSPKGNEILGLLFDAHAAELDRARRQLLRDLRRVQRD